MPKQNIKKFKLIILFIASTILLTACKEEKKDSITKTAFLLDTVITITLYDSEDENILNDAIDLIDGYENIYSKTLKSSELFQLNNRTLPHVDGQPSTYRISNELSELLKYGLEYSDLSEGKFDVTIEPISRLWDFKSEHPKIPEEGLIKKGLESVGHKNIILEGNLITMKDDTTTIDLGAIAKGYIADRVKDFLQSKGVESAIINLGGNVLCIGEKSKGESFKIGIQKPFENRNEIIATMDIKDQSVVTSGIYERYFIKDSKVYHHIISPVTGYPYENNLISVTIISPHSVDGDGLSTTCFAMGLKEGMELVNGLENIHGIFITKDYKIHYSQGFFEDIVVTEVED